MDYISEMFKVLGYDVQKINGYEKPKESDIVCQLCDGKHGNNSNCQRNDKA